jgi:hypothetical protein
MFTYAKTSCGKPPVALGFFAQQVSTPPRPRRRDGVKTATTITPRPPSTVTSPLTCAAKIAAVIAASLAHVIVLVLLTPGHDATSITVNWFAAIVPALITFTLLPSSLRYWRGWLIFVGVLIITSQVWIVPAILVTESVLLYGAWFTHRVPGELRNPLRRRTPPR